MMIFLCKFSLIYIIAGNERYADWIKQHREHPKLVETFFYPDSNRMMVFKVKCSCGEENTLKIHEPKI